MKICLAPYPLDEILETYLPLGVLTLATLLEEAGHEVVVVDPTWAVREGTLPPSATPDQVAELLHAQTPDLLGFSTICSSYPRVLEWARAYHQLSPHTPIVLGGPQATAVDQQTLRAFPWIDMVLRGEAENSIVPLAHCLEQGGDLDGVPGLTWRRGDEIIRNTDAEPVLDLDSLPTPAYHLYPMVELARQQQALELPMIGLEAGRGCPFGCTFCSTSHFFKRRYRAKSVDRLIEDMLLLHERYGIQKLSLQHDLFTCNKKYVLEFCRHLRDRGLHDTLQWGCSSRIDTVDERVLAEMAAAGCQHVFFGVETGSARMQRLIGKNLAPQQVKPIVQAAVSQGLHTVTSFICGFPQERNEDLAETLTLILDLIGAGVHEVQLNVLAPLAGSELYRTFHHAICFTKHLADISYAHFSAEEQHLIHAHPNIFGNFYHFEVPHLNHQSLRAMSAAIRSCPHLLVALGENEVDLLSLLEHWPAWYQARVPDAPVYYYRQTEFRQDFYSFLQEILGDGLTVMPNVADLIEYHLVRERVAASEGNGRVATHHFSCDVLALMTQLIDGEPPAEKAEQPTTYLFTNANGDVLVKRLTPALQRLLGGSRHRRAQGCR